MNAINFKPLSDRVLIDVITIKPKEEKIKLLDENNTPKSRFEEWPFQGIVLAVGDGFNQEGKMGVEVGDHVYLQGPFDPERDIMMINKKMYALVRQAFIVGIVPQIKKPVNKNVEKSN